MENEKCPVCITGTLEGWNRKVRQGDSCGFQCDTDDLPSIAAAMDLARASINYDSMNEATEAHDWDVLYVARNRVLEVFGGE